MRGPGARLGGVAGAGAPVRQQRAVGDQVVRRGVGDLDGRRRRRAATARRRRRPRSAPAGCRGPGRTAGRSRRPCGPRPRRPAPRRVRPTSAWFSAQAISSTAARPAARSAPARPPWAPGRPSSAAGVPGRLEYWKVKALAKRACADDVQGLLEVLLGLAGEADDDVGGDRGVGHRGADPLDDPEVALAAGTSGASPRSTGRSRTAAACAAAGMTFGVSAIAAITSSVKSARVRAGEAHPLQARRSSPQARSSLPNACRSPNSTP